MRSISMLAATLMLLGTPAFAEQEIPISEKNLAVMADQIMRNWNFDPGRLPECPEPFTVGILLAPDGKVEKVESTSDLADGYCKTLFESFRRAVYITGKFDIPAGVTLESLDFTIDPSMLVY